MHTLGDKTFLSHTYDKTKDTLLFDEVSVVTGSEMLFKERSHDGGYVNMSKNPHESGSDRIADAVTYIEVDIILYVQGDEPFVAKESLEKSYAERNNRSK